MHRAKNVSIALHAVSDYAAPAVFAVRRKGMNSALEGIELVSTTILDDAKRTLIVITACVADCHGVLLCSPARSLAGIDCTENSGNYL